MDSPDPRDSAGDSRFIPGIYNYCDRWCERCPFASRCRTYADSEQLQRHALGQHDTESRADWDQLDAAFREAQEMVGETFADEDVELDQAELDEFIQQENRKREDVRNHPLSRAADRYADMLSAWFEARPTLFEEETGQLKSEFLPAAGDDAALVDAALLTDAVEVVRWYQFFICAKLMRALHSDDELAEEYDFPKDSDGSAKAALLAMDRSIGAWGVLREHLRNEGDSILDLLAHLVRLRRHAERVFPDARAFVRPGFDEPFPPARSEREGG